MPKSVMVEVSHVRSLLESEVTAEVVKITSIDIEPVELLSSGNRNFRYILVAQFAPGGNVYSDYPPTRV